MNGVPTGYCYPHNRVHRQISRHQRLHGLVLEQDEMKLLASIHELCLPLLSQWQQEEGITEFEPWFTSEKELANDTLRNLTFSIILYSALSLVLSNTSETSKSDSLANPLDNHPIILSILAPLTIFK